MRESMKIEKEDENDKPNLKFQDQIFNKYMSGMEPFKKKQID